MNIESPYSMETVDGRDRNLVMNELGQGGRQPVWGKTHILLDFLATLPPALLESGDHETVYKVVEYGYRDVKANEERDIHTPLHVGALAAAEIIDRDTRNLTEFGRQHISDLLTHFQLVRKNRAY